MDLLALPRLEDFDTHIADFFSRLYLPDNWSLRFSRTWVPHFATFNGQHIRITVIKASGEFLTRISPVTFWCVIDDAARWDAIVAMMTELESRVAEKRIRETMKMGESRLTGLAPLMHTFSYQ